MLGHFFKNVIIKNIDSMIRSLSASSRIVEIRDHHFLNRLNTQSTAVDLGAHKGEFSARIIQTFGCRCISVEANPELYNAISESPLVQKCNYAICGQNGPVSLFLSSNLEATSIMKDVSDFWGTTECVQVPGIRFEDFIEKHRIQKIHLLKVDIEGAEIEMFGSMSDRAICGIEQISVEFHGFCNPPLAREASLIKKRLRHLGFLCLPFPFRDSYGLDCDTLFINKALAVADEEGRAGIGIPLLTLRLLLYLRFMALCFRLIKNRFISI